MLQPFTKIVGRGSRNVCMMYSSEEQHNASFTKEHSTSNGCKKIDLILHTGTGFLFGLRKNCIFNNEIIIGGIQILRINRKWLFVCCYSIFSSFCHRLIAICVCHRDLRIGWVQGFGITQHRIHFDLSLIWDIIRLSPLFRIILKFLQQYEWTSIRLARRMTTVFEMTNWMNMNWDSYMTCC